MRRYTIVVDVPDDYLDPAHTVKVEEDYFQSDTQGAVTDLIELATTEEFAIAINIEDLKQPQKEKCGVPGPGNLSVKEN